MLPFSLTIGGFIRSRGRCLLPARPQTASDSSNHSTSPMGGGCLTPSAMSLGRDNRIARRYYEGYELPLVCLLRGSRKAMLVARPARAHQFQTADYFVQRASRLHSFAEHPQKTSN